MKKIPISQVINVRVDRFLFLSIKSLILQSITLIYFCTGCFITKLRLIRHHIMILRCRIHHISLAPRGGGALPYIDIRHVPVNRPTNLSPIAPYFWMLAGTGTSLSYMSAPRALGTTCLQIKVNSLRLKTVSSSNE